MTGIQKWIILGAAFSLVTNGPLYSVYADHDRHKEKQWFQNIFDWDDDDDNHHDHKQHRNNSKQHKKRYLTRKRVKPERLEAKIGKEIGRDGRFIAYSKGVVIDTETGLMWAAKDNGSDINYKGAKAYCENYRGAGYKDWRMPNLDELEGLYDEDVSQDCAGACYVTRLIDLTNCCPWASDVWGSEAAVFYFVVGKRSLSPQSYSVFRRALPVRAGN